MRSIEPGISRFRVRLFEPPRNDVGRVFAYTPCANCPSCQFAASRRALPCRANQNDHPRVPHPYEGRFAIVTDVGCGMRWTRRVVGRTAQCGRRNRVVLAPLGWRQVCGDRSAGDGGNKAWSPGRARISRNTIAQGRPDVTAKPVVPTPCFFFARGPWVLAKHPAFPAPSESRRDGLIGKLGHVVPRERGVVSSFFARPSRRLLRKLLRTRSSSAARRHAKPSW